jgi:hypothetical protein
MERFVEPILNYSHVQTIEDFQRWAVKAFELPYAAGATRREISLALFELLNVENQCLVVREANKSHMTQEMRSLMTDPTDGLYPVLGFHLPREGTGALVSFRRAGLFSQFIHAIGR